LVSENLEVHWDSNSESGSSLASVGVHSLTFSYTPESMKCDSWASLLARPFASPCLGCEPKAKVATIYFSPQSSNNLTIHHFHLAIPSYIGSNQINLTTHLS